MELSKLILTDILAVNRIIHHGPDRIRRENRPRSALALKLSGRSVYRTSEGEFLSAPDRIVVLPRGLSYTCEVLEPGECVMVEADFAEAPDTVLVQTVPDPVQTAQLAAQMEKAWGNPGGLHRCLALIYEWMAGMEQRAGRYTTSQHRGKLAEGMAYLREHFREPTLTNGEIAEHLGWSEPYFRREFTREFGKPPRQYLLELRLTRAGELLLSDTGSIAEVAALSGFSNLSHFSRTFRRVNGVSPTEYAEGRTVKKTL